MVAKTSFVLLSFVLLVNAFMVANAFDDVDDDLYNPANYGNFRFEGQSDDIFLNVTNYIKGDFHAILRTVNHPKFGEAEIDAFKIYGKTIMRINANGELSCRVIDNLDIFEEAKSKISKVLRFVRDDMAVPFEGNSKTQTLLSDTNEEDMVVHEALKGIEGKFLYFCQDNATTSDEGKKLRYVSNYKFDADINESALARVMDCLNTVVEVGAEYLGLVEPSPTTEASSSSAAESSN